MKSTTDIWFTSFLILHRGYELEKTHKLSRGKGKFYFKMSDEKWEEEKRMFFKSDVSKLKQCQERLKDLFF